MNHKEINSEIVLSNASPYKKDVFMEFIYVKDGIVVESKEKEFILQKGYNLLASDYLNVEGATERDKVQCSIWNGSEKYQQIFKSITLPESSIPTYQVATPYATPSEGEYELEQEVVLDTSTKEAEIYYTLDGTKPTKDSLLFVEPIQIIEDTELRAIAMYPGMMDSEEAVFRYTIENSILFRTPQVSITGPKDGETIKKQSNKNIDIEVDASIKIGHIEEVVFYVNGVEVGRDYEAPYEHTYVPDLKGTYHIQAKALSGEGVEGESESITVYVVPDLQINVEQNAQVNTSSITNKMTIRNNTGEEIDFNELSLRYYYTVEKEAKQNFWCDYAAVTMNKDPWHVDFYRTVKGIIRTLPEQREQADHYLEIQFNNPSIMFKDQSTIQLNTRIDNSQWTSYDQSNDFSYNQAEKIVVLYKGEELYGSIPEIQEEVPEAILTSPSMNQQITTGSALMIEVDTNLKEEDVESIEFYIDGEQVTQINVKPYRYEFIVVEAKDYEIFCKVITREGLELITDSIWIKANKSDREILEE